MSDQIRKLAPLIWSEIQKANRILLHCHPNPDGDSVGGTLAMKLALEDIRKKVDAIWGDSEPAMDMATAPGFDQIIAKNIFQINLAKYDLFIIQDSSSLEQISSKHQIVFPSSLNTIVIDHHKSNNGFGKLNLVISNYPANCQILAELFSNWKLNITSKIATNLLMGIYTDSVGFRTETVDGNTFAIVGRLVSTGANLSKLIYEIENNYDSRLVEYLGKFFSTVEHYFSGRVAICSANYNDYYKGQFPAEINLPDLSNIISSARGNLIAIALKEKEPGKTYVSLRRRDDKYDLSKITIATGYGGGHSGAAGARIPLPINDAKKFLLETIQKVYPDLGQP